MGGFLFQCSWLEVTVLMYGKWISHFISERSVEPSKVDVEAVHKQASKRIKYLAQWGKKSIRKGKTALFIHLAERFSGGGF